MASETTRRAVEAVDEAFVVKTAMELTDIYTPTGSEIEAARYLLSRASELGLPAKLQQLTERSGNVVAVLEGSGGGPTLIFNGHLDISHTEEETALPGGDNTFVRPAELAPGYLPEARIVDERWIYGSGVYNMKGSLAAFLACVEAIKRADIELPGSVVFTGVAGEIEKSPVDDFTQDRYQGYGQGTRFLLSHGVTGDACIVGEPTALKVTTGHAGTLWAKLTTRGTLSHTAWVHRGTNAIEVMARVIERLQAWIPGYRSRNSAGGVEPGVNLGAIRGGWPWRASRSPIYCSLYVDVRIMPGQFLADVQEELRDLVSDMAADGISVEMEFVASAPPFWVRPNEGVVEAVEGAHELVVGGPPEHAFQGWGSDAIHFQHYHIPTVVYGPGGRLRTGGEGWTPEPVWKGMGEGEHQHIDDLVTAARVYAATAVEFCSQARQQVIAGRPSQVQEG